MAKLNRVLIVGGGIGGLSLAAALTKVGIPAEVFEQSPALREVGAGVGLWSNALASLDQIGAGDTLRRHSMPLRTLAGANAQGRDIIFLRLDDLGAEFSTAACYIVLRPALLAALEAQVPREAIHVDARAAHIESSPDSVRLHFESGQTEEGDLLIGTDGIDSVVRPFVIGAADAHGVREDEAGAHGVRVDKVRYSGQTAFRGVAKLQPPEPAVLREIQGVGLRGAVCAVDAQTVYWYAALNFPAKRILPPAERRAFLLEKYRGWPFGLEQAIAATASEAILQTDLVDRPPATRYVNGRVALLGDAAHPTTPNLGQGANMAIDDAIVLARCLRDAASVDEGLARYQQLRLPRTRKIVERSWDYGRMCLWTSPLAVALREMMTRATPKIVMRSALRWQILETVGSL